MVFLVSKSGGRETEKNREGWRRADRKRESYAEKEVNKDRQ